MHFIVAFVVLGFKKIFYMITKLMHFVAESCKFFLKGRFIINDQTKFFFIETKTWFKTLFYICNLFIEFIQF